MALCSNCQWVHWPVLDRMLGIKNAECHNEKVNELADNRVFAIYGSRGVPCAQARGDEGLCGGKALNFYPRKKVGYAVVP